MKVLIDECVPLDFRHSITGHDAFTVAYMGWKVIINGRLLSLAVGSGFEAFVTTDRGVEFEQHVAAIPIAVFVLYAATNDLDDLNRLVPALLAALNHAQPRSVTRIQP
jgi:hypothetical protein